MSDPLAEAYFHWLEPQVRETQGHQRKTFVDVLARMYQTEFVWLIPNDDNRVQDGLDLRPRFAEEGGHSARRLQELGPCSVLEVLIALSQRLSFVAEGPAEGWAWVLFVNLEFDKYPDPLNPRKARQVDSRLDALVWRTYQPDGQGGFFPLGFPDDDQTKVELWYQMSAYVDEIHPGY